MVFKIKVLNKPQAKCSYFGIMERSYGEIHSWTEILSIAVKITYRRLMTFFNYFSGDL